MIANLICMIIGVLLFVMLENICAYYAIRRIIKEKEVTIKSFKGIIRVIVYLVAIISVAYGSIATLVLQYVYGLGG